MATTKNFLVAFVFLLTSTLNAQEQTTKEKRTINTTKIEQNKIILDGVLDEDEWRLVSPATNFIQRDPNEGTPSTEKTEVYVIHDKDNLYPIGFKSQYVEGESGIIFENSILDGMDVFKEDAPAFQVIATCECTMHGVYRT